MTGQHPFEGVVEEFLDGIYEDMPPPNQPGRSTQPLLHRVPPEVIAREEEGILVEEGHASRGMTRHGNDTKLRHDFFAVTPLNNPF